MFVALVLLATDLAKTKTACSEITLDHSILNWCCPKQVRDILSQIKATSLRLFVWVDSLLKLAPGQNSLLSVDSPKFNKFHEKLSFVL